jgi:lipopolysaccharide export system permease protein
MKILDRYVLVTFLKNYLISFMVLVGMYVVLDMVFNFDELVDVKGVGEASKTDLWETVLGIGDFYFYQIFIFFVYLSGMIPVVAAAFTLIRLSRFNELTAVLAAGVPMLRIALPIVLAGLVLQVLLYVDQQYLIPQMIPKLMRDHDERSDASAKSFEIRAMQDNDLGLIRASRYTPATPQAPATMEIVDITERQQVDRQVMGSDGTPVLGPDGQPVVRRNLQASAHITADKAVWNDAAQQWDLENGQRVTGLSPDALQSAVEPALFYKSNVTPEEVALYRSGDWVEFLSSGKIDELIQRPGSYGQTHLMRVKHWRFVQPIMNLVLLLLAIPFLMTREPGKLKSAATKCLVVTAMGMGAVFLSHQLAGTTPPRPEWTTLWPALMAWMPVFVFGPVAYLFLERVKT